MTDRAGTPAQESDLIDVHELVSAYYAKVPDLSDPAQRVVFGTSGHRGSSFDAAFNETHIAAITQAIVEYRTGQGITGPLFVGRDTHGLSSPAETTALSVLEANGVAALTDEYDDYVPTPALSRAIVAYNRSVSAGRTPGGLADGIVIKKINKNNI
jgi:phosphoglucomutase